MYMKILTGFKAIRYIYVCICVLIRSYNCSNKSIHSSVKSVPVLAEKQDILRSGQASDNSNQLFCRATDTLSNYVAGARDGNANANVEETSGTGMGAECEVTF